MKIHTIAFFIFFFFSLVGLVTTSLVVHEYSHKSDLKAIAQDGKIGLFVIPDTSSLKDFLKEPAAYYSYYIDDEDKQEEERIIRYTEWKAYTLGSLVVVFYMIAQGIVIWRWTNEKNN